MPSRYMILLILAIFYVKFSTGFLNLKIQFFS